MKPDRAFFPFEDIYSKKHVNFTYILNINKLIGSKILNLFKRSSSHTKPTAEEIYFPNI